MLGFGSIGKGTVPLLERHVAFDRAKFTVIAPDDRDRALLDERHNYIPASGDHARELS